MENLKSEFSKNITVEQLIALHDEIGLAVEINDGEIVGSILEEV